MKKPEIVKLPEMNKFSLYFAGLVLMSLTKIKSKLTGYKTPRTFSVHDFNRAFEYDNKVVWQWIEALKLYSGKDFGIKNRTILELGPGADLGVGLLLLSKGAKKYNSLDVNNLVKTVPPDFYEAFFERISELKDDEIDIGALRKQLKLTLSGKNDQLNYMVSDRFDLNVFESNSIDLVFSQAAFEHFENIERLIEALGSVVKKGAVLIAEIDLKTHTRWLRDADPLSIYRYSEFVYNFFRYSGIPNRIRPVDYRRFFESSGWTDVRTYPLTILERDYVIGVRSSLHKNFRDDKNEMDQLSILLCATKK